MNRTILAAMTIIVLACAQAGAQSAPASAPATEPASKPALTPQEMFAKFQQLQAQMLRGFQDKEYAKAAEAAEELVQLPLQAEIKGESYYNLACAQARLNQAEKAMTSLEKAAELGWDNADHAAKDPDLESLRSEKRFLAALEKMRAGAPPSFERNEDVTTVTGKPAGGLQYRIRMSPAATKEKPDRLIVWLHPSGGSANEAAEALAPMCNRKGFAVMVLTRKSFMGWSQQDALRLVGTLNSLIGNVPGLDARRPLLMGFSAGGQMALMMWAQKPGQYGGLILDAAYPIVTTETGQYKAMPLPESGADKTPIFVLVGTADGGSGVWRNAEKSWREAGVPLTIEYIKDGKHAWLFGADQQAKLGDWLADVAAGKLPGQAAATTMPASVPASAPSE